MTLSFNAIRCPETPQCTMNRASLQAAAKICFELLICKRNNYACLRCPNGHSFTAPTACICLCIGKIFAELRIFEQMPIRTACTRERQFSGRSPHAISAERIR